MIQLEQKAIADFQRRFANGDFGSQRYGQAFYDHFKLDRVSSQKAEMDKIYNVDNGNFSAVFHQYIEVV